MARWRTLLILGRVSNLPTVWSNCMAGWWLGGGERFDKLPLLIPGVTALYLGGMFLNDAFDEEFDRQHRPERPIPSGAISAAAVWRWGLASLGLGSLLLIGLGTETGLLGLVLALCILAYNATHKALTIAPLLMALCRFFVYIVAASVAVDGVIGQVVWCALALGAYVAGLSFLARHESTGGHARYWAVALLASPVLLALLLNANGYRQAALLLSLILALWIVRSLRPFLWSAQHPLGRTVSYLLAGIVLVDWLAVADAPRILSGIFIALFILALILQRSVPAT